MSTDIVGLAGALSEWSGGTRSAAEVSDILAKAMLGEKVALKSLGISISEADIQQKILGMSTEQLSTLTLEQQKAIATRDLILEKSVDAQNAYKDNTDGLSVAQAALSSSLGTLKEEIAIALIPTFKEMASVISEDVVPFITDTFIPALQEHLPSAIETTKEMFSALNAVFQIILPSIKAHVEILFEVAKAIGFVAGKIADAIGWMSKEREANKANIDVYQQSQEQLEKTFESYNKFGGAISDVTKKSLENAAQLNTEEEKLKEITKFKGMAITKTEEFATATESTTAAIGKSTDALTAHALATQLVTEGFFELDQAAQNSTMELVVASFKRTAAIENETERTAALINSLAKAIRGDAGLDSGVDFVGSFSNVTQKTGLTEKEEMEELVNKQLDEIGNVIDGFQAVEKGNTEKGKFGFNVTSGVGAITQRGILGGSMGGTAADPMAAFRSIQAMSAKYDHAFDLDSVVAKQVADTLGAQAIQQMKSGQVNLNFDISVSEMTDPQAVGDKILEILAQNDLVKAGALDTIGAT